MAKEKINAPYDPLIDAIAIYALGQQDHSDEALEVSALCLADALGCAIAALQFPACTKLLGAVVPGTIVPNGCRIPGRPDILDPIRGAFNLGTMIRWLDYNDTWLAAEWAHPSDNIGGLLTLGDHLNRKNQALGQAPLTGKKLLSAIIKAYEIQGVLALSNSFNRIGLDHVGFVKIATSAAAGYLLEASYGEIAAAISNACIDIAPLRTYRHAPNVGSRKSWAAGDATSRGVQFALMAMQGEMGYPTALSAKRWGVSDVLFQGKPLTLERPLASYVIENILFKVSFPAEFHAQTAVEGAIQLHRELGTRLHDIAEIESIDIETHESALRIIDKKGQLHNPADRDHCLQYMVAIGLLYGELTASHYEDEIAQTPKIDALRQKMTLTENRLYTADYLAPDKRSIANKISIRFKDGTSSSTVAIEYPIGHKKRRLEAYPLLQQKLETNLATLYPKHRVAMLLSLFQDVPKLMALSISDIVEAFAL